MNARLDHPTACPQCLRRGALLGVLAPYIERIVTGGATVGELMALSDDELARRVSPTTAHHVGSPTRQTIESSGCWSICQHTATLDYPSGLRELPYLGAIYGRGAPALLAELSPSRVVSVVGARRASSYGRDVARQLGRDLAAAGIVVVSGLAFGIDACAHRGALETGRTVAVLGCGPDVAYPAAHRSLWRRIQENGLVLSELPPGTGAWRWSFPARNRIMAALAEMTVVVEAAEKSGSLLTAEIARDLGREVGAVPGPVNSRTSAGSNDLLADGASLVRNAEDILNARLSGGPIISAPQPLDPLQVRRDARAIIGEDRVPTDVLHDLVTTYGEADR